MFWSGMAPGWQVIFIRVVMRIQHVPVEVAFCIRVVEVIVIVFII